MKIVVREIFSPSQMPVFDSRCERCSREVLESAVAAAFAVPLVEMRAATRRAPAVAFARQSAMYLAHVVLSLSYTEVGRLFGRDRTTAAHACRLVEDRRDDPRLDAVLGALESACCTWAGREVRS